MFNLVFKCLTDSYMKLLLWELLTLIIIDIILLLNRQKQEEMIMADMHLKPGEPWEYCPREALRKVSRLLKEEFNLVSNIFMP